MNSFNLTRSVKPPDESVIKRILVRCPSTGKLTATGKTVKEALWDKTKTESSATNLPALPPSPQLDEKDVVLAR